MLTKTKSIVSLLLLAINANFSITFATEDTPPTPVNTSSNSKLSSTEPTRDNNQLGVYVLENPLLPFSSYIEGGIHMSGNFFTWVRETASSFGFRYDIDDTSTYPPQPIELNNEEVGSYLTHNPFGIPKFIADLLRPTTQ